jgi:hypothetical protein
MSMEDGQHPRRQRMMHIPCLLFLQAVLIVLFGFFVEYDSPAEPEIHGSPKVPVTQEGVGNSSGAGKKTAEGANGHHRSNDDVNTLGHYYPSKSLSKFACVVKRKMMSSLRNVIVRLVWGAC